MFVEYHNEMEFNPNTNANIMFSETWSSPADLIASSFLCDGKIQDGWVCPKHKFLFQYSGD